VFRTAAVPATFLDKLVRSDHAGTAKTCSGLPLLGIFEMAAAVMIGRTIDHDIADQPRVRAIADIRVVAMHVVIRVRGPRSHAIAGADELAVPLTAEIALPTRVLTAQTRS
jgi:hypothetical protein